MFHSRSPIVIAAAGVAVAIVVLAVKYAAYVITGSVALYSDALESIVNVVTALAALAALYWSAKPADSNHPYGHTKAEYFSAVVEGVLIVVAAVAIFREAYYAFLHPHLLERPAEGLIANAAASLLNGGWCFILFREGRRRSSPALLADARHLLTDLVSSGGVVVGLVLAVATGFAVLDPILAVVVGAVILGSGWSLIRLSLSGLMDEAVEPELLDRIREVIGKEAIGAIEAHDIRTRHAGRVTFIDFHLVVPGSMSVSEAHDICDRVEQGLKVISQDALITIHVEPEAKAKHHGVVVL